jgi:hypothetical protein
MSLKVLFLAFSFHTHGNLDTVPAMHNILEADIDTAFATYKERTITVKLKTGDTYTYTADQWRKEMVPGVRLAPRLDEATGLLDRTYTKTEVPPTFPGGQTAWLEYQSKIYSEHKRLIKKYGPATIYIQFIVSFDGQMDQVQLIGNAPAELGDLAIRMIKEGPAWEPATENGRKVTCYTHQKIDFQ